MTIIAILTRVLKEEAARFAVSISCWMFPSFAWGLWDRVPCPFLWIAQKVSPAKNVLTIS